MEETGLKWGKGILSLKGQIINNNIFSSNAKITKRKRSKNTTAQQFELYLEAMEGDYVFRSNTINPSLPPNYLNHKWEELTAKLNGVGDGPALTVDEWKKVGIIYTFICM